MGNLNDRQMAILEALLRNMEGLGIDEFVTKLGITRTAVRQHLTGLERDGLVERGPLRPTAGRPSRAFVLTPRGRERFPRQYAWFALGLLQSLKLKDRTKLAPALRAMGTDVGAKLAARADSMTGKARLDELVKVMNELGYHAEPDPRTGSVLAHNCVFHGLAERFPEICEFDLAFLSRLAGETLALEGCIAGGAHACRFRRES
jgi:predicted ArsR family transcriptional regulator